MISVFKNEARRKREWRVLVFGARTYVEVNRSAGYFRLGAHAARSGVLERELNDVLSVIVLPTRQHSTLYIPTLVLADEQTV